MKKLILLSTLMSLVCSQEYACLASGRDFVNYDLKQGKTVVYKGQTNDLDRREREHRQDGKEFTHIKKVEKAKTLIGSKNTEKKALETYRKNHQGQNPKYNKTWHG